MAPDPATPAGDPAQSKTVMSRLLGVMSVFTMLMTIPQVLTIWVGHQAAGVSVVSDAGTNRVRVTLSGFSSICARQERTYLPSSFASAVTFWAVSA